MSFYCYLLCTQSGGYTYVGATTDPDRRLEQHNGHKAGGARATALQVARGEIWRRVCVIEGIPEWRSALQLEWRWKQLSRPVRKGTGKRTKDRPLTRRLRALHELLLMEKPTESAIPYEMYPEGPPRIRWEREEDKVYYECLFKVPAPAPPASGQPRSCLSTPSASNEIGSSRPVPSSPPSPHAYPPRPDGVNR